MKILHVIASVNPRNGGPVVGVRVLAEAAESHRDELEILSLDRPESDYLTNFPAVVHALGPVRGTYSFSMRLMRWLRVNAANYDAIVVHGLWQFHGLAVWWALRNTVTPYFVFPHGMLGSWFKKSFKIKHVKKLLYWVLFERRILRDARKVLFTCTEELEQAPTTFPFYRGDGVVVGYAASEVPANRKHLKEQWYAKHPDLETSRAILVLGRVHPVKGCDLALQAFAEVAAVDPDLRLIIAGPDEMQTVHGLQQLAKTFGVWEKVRWTGMLDEQSKWGAILAAEVLMAPSHHENFGVAIAEALSCGKPVLISNKVNTWREISSSNAGLVGDDTASGTIKSLKLWLGFSHEERCSMSDAASFCYAANFSPKHFERKVRDVLATVHLEVRNRRAFALPGGR